MRKLWLIIKREYITRVKSKGFVIGTVALPALTVGLFVFSIFMATRQLNNTLRVAIVDGTGRLAPAVAAGLEYKLPNGRPAFDVVQVVGPPAADQETREQMRRRVSDGDLDGYLFIPKDVSSEDAVEFHARNTGDFGLGDQLGRVVSRAVIAERLGARGIPVTDLESLVHNVEVNMVKVTATGEIVEKGQTFLVAIVVAMVLYTTLIMYGVLTMRSVLEEKTTRIVEVLVSAVRPFQLLVGKLVGVAGVAFTQYLIWGVTAALVTAYGASLAGALRPGAQVPQIHVPNALLAYAVVFFLLGYFLYASLFAAVASAASNEQDAQQLQWPITLPLIVSFVMFNLILRAPDSTTSTVLSEIPLFTPILMILRIAAETPPFWQIGLSILLLILTTLGVVYLSARIYRVGVLMYGKRPSLVELVRWLRYS